MKPHLNLWAREQYRQRLFMLQCPLSEGQRLAVQLRHIDELTNPQIAEIMGVSVEAIESLITQVNAINKNLQSHKSS